MCIYTGSYISRFCPLRKPRNKHISVTVTSTNTQKLALIPFSNKMNKVLLEKGLILWPGQGVHKMSLDPLVVPKDKEVLKKDDDDMPSMQRRQTNKKIF